MIFSASAKVDICGFSPLDFTWKDLLLSCISAPPPPLSRVNDAMKHMFTQNRRIDNILPTLHALEHHVKRAAYQAGHIWGQSL